MTALHPQSTKMGSEGTQASGALRDDFGKLRPFEDSELVLGLIAPFGSDLDIVRTSLQRRLEVAGYDVNIVRLTEDVIPSASRVATYPPNDFGARAEALMDAGDTAREKSGDNGILALGATKIIGGLRELRSQEAADRPRRAYIVSSLKHPAEVETLRMIYPQGFYLLAVHEDPSDRLRRLILNKGMDESKAKSLMERDKDGHARFGQRVRAAFHLADFFVRVDHQSGYEERLKCSIVRIVDLLFGSPYLTPTFDEFAMFMAFASSLRSADLSRQVGAVLARDEQIISSGANDCPRFGGGLYWPSVNAKTGEVEDFENGRDFKRGSDSNAMSRREIMDNVINEASKLTDDSVKLEAFKTAVERSRIRDITEYGRVVHAEMEAMLSCARIGVSTVGSTLYGTTYPCHNCAKHIIASGITRVVYIEPYPKSKALEFHNEALEEGFSEGQGAEAMDSKVKKVLFEPFVGVGPRRFFDLFSISLGSGGPVSRKDDSSGEILAFQPESGKLRLQMLPNSYREVEGEATDAFEKFVNQREGSPSESESHPTGKNPHYSEGAE